jgi:hypothetical protein
MIREKSARRTPAHCATKEDTALVETLPCALDCVGDRMMMAATMALAAENDFIAVFLTAAALP